MRQQLIRRYPNSPPPRPTPVEPRTDPQLVRRYPTHFTDEQRAAAARELAPEITPPPEVDAASAEFQAFKTAAQAAGLDNGSASKLLTEYGKALAARKR